MKKFLLIAAAAAVTVSASAFDLAESNLMLHGRKTPARAICQAPTENGYELRFCQDLYTWMGLSGLNSEMEMREYLYITPEIATELAGNKIESITFSACFGSSTSAEYRRPGKIFVAEDIKGSYDVSKDVEIFDGYTAQSPQTEKFDADAEYVIKENTGFYFGVAFNVTGDNYPLAIDGYGANSFAGAADFYSNGQFVTTIDIADQGTNLFLYCNTVGEKKGLTNIFSCVDVALGNFELPVFVNATDAVASIYVRNLGSNAIETVDYTVQFNDGEPVSSSANVNLDGETNGYVGVPVNGLPKGRNVLGFTVDKINGVELGQQFEVDFFNLEEGVGYPRKFVVEEGTGTWCGWCPRGIVGLSYMSQKYPDSFIGIAVHVSDDMEVASYEEFAYYYFSGFPTSVINRDAYYIGVDPSSEVLEQAYTIWKDEVSPVKVDLGIEANPYEIKATANTTFAVDNISEYALAFVILEDGITGRQANYYSGGSTSCDGWEKKGSSVSWKFEHTARDIFDTFGIENSLPTNITAGTPYEYSMSLSLENVTKVENTSVVAFVLDKATGNILNAAKVAAADYTSSVETLLGTENAPVEYFNLQGVRIANPETGSIVIRRQGEKVGKTVVR